MFKKYIERIEDAGVVGAGGAGFPTHIKLNNSADIVIANGTECEPLLRVDRQLMETWPEKVVEGLRIAMKITNAERGVICLKDKYHSARDALQKAIGSIKNISLHLTGSYYPAGDEQQLVYEITGKVVPSGGIPIQAGAVVINVGTLLGIVDAVEGTPVTTRFVTVTGEVGTPVTLNVPIGTPVGKLTEIAGGPAQSHGYSIILGGPVMGSLGKDWLVPVTKTLGGIIVLADSHTLVSRKNATMDRDIRMARSLCCQCNYCTQLCPRNLLGLRVKPHKVMRAVGYGNPTAAGDPETVFGCCDCGLCTYYACPMGLSPGRMVSTIKAGLSRNGIKPQEREAEGVSDTREYRKVPVQRLIERLGLGKYDRAAPLQPGTVEVSEVRIPLKQHIGVAAVPCVSKGDYVKKGDLIGKLAEGCISANIHASITGEITDVSNDFIKITLQ